LIKDLLFQHPQAGDFIIGNLTQSAGRVTPVTITPKEKKSDGKITIYYNGSTTLPQTAGNYEVTFDVAESKGLWWYSAKGFYAGTLIINNVIFDNAEFL